MSLAVVEAGWLWLAPLIVLPLRRSVLAAGDYSWNALLPADRLSRFVDIAIRTAGVVAFSGLLLGLAGLYRKEQWIDRVGQGTNLVLLLDRSRSMDDNFAGRTPSGPEESKSAAAERILGQFIDARPHDRIGVAAFSSSALYVLPLTENRDALHAAVRAIRLPGLAQTHVAKGLGMALSYFGPTEPPGSRSIVLVSDGAAVIDPHIENALRRWFVEQGVRLYWIFLRTAGAPGIFEVPDAANDTPEARPERYLHQFFAGLGIPYHAFEADSPDAVGRAIGELDRLERYPMSYRELRPRADLRGPSFVTAALALLALVAVKRMESR